MAGLTAIISTNAASEPELGPEIPTVLKGVRTDKRRALIGWNHQNDTPDGLRSGKVWCWVSEGDKLQVFDENFNRSEIAGDVRFCGVANFTMVRMFHPYWSLFGRAPRDMVSNDKQRCRAKYLQLIRRWRIRNGLPVDDDADNEIQPDESDQPRRNRRRSSRRSRAGRAPRAGGQSRRNRQIPQVVTGREQQIAGFAANDPLAISDDEDSDWNDNIPLVQRSRPGIDNARLGDMRKVITSIFGNTNPSQGPAEGTSNNIKREDEVLETIQSTGAPVNAAPSSSALQDSTIFTSPFNDISREATQGTETEQRLQDMRGDYPALPLLEGYDDHFDEIRNAIADSLNHTSGNTTQETTQESVEGDVSVRERETAATITEPENEVKKEDYKVVNWVSPPVLPEQEVIVIDD